MNSIAIILIDKLSITENIIINSINYLKKSKLKKIYLIGNKEIFPKIFLIVKKNQKFEFINLNYNKKKKFHYINQATEVALNLYREKKINFLINMPFNKKDFLPKNFFGYTEFFSFKTKSLGNETMLMYGNKFSVSPLTTHEKLKFVSKKITKRKIITAINNINNFYKNFLNKKVHIKILGLNPHAGKDIQSKNTEELKTIVPAINYLKKKINISGPLSADSAFSDYKNSVYLGMYHDQVLTPFKLINKFKGINITLGNDLIRMSPDHGTGLDLLKSKKKINITSFIMCIKFCENSRNA